MSAPLGLNKGHVYDFFGYSGLAYGAAAILGAFTLPVTVGLAAFVIGGTAITYLCTDGRRSNTPAEDGFAPGDTSYAYPPMPEPSPQVLMFMEDVNHMENDLSGFPKEWSDALARGETIESVRRRKQAQHSTL